VRFSFDSSGTRQPVPEFGSGGFEIGDRIQSLCDVLLDGALDDGEDDAINHHVLAIGIDYFGQSGLAQGAKTVPQPHRGEERRRMAQQLVAIGHVKAGISIGKCGQVCNGRDQLGTSLRSERQQRAGNIMASVDRHHPRGDTVPVDQRLRRAPLQHGDGLCLTQQVPQFHRMPGNDLAHFIERHDRVAQRPHVGLVRRLLVPAPALEIVLDKIEVAGSDFLRQQILEGTAPEISFPMRPDPREQRLGIESCLIQDWPKMGGQGFVHCFGPG
jgi:hypothetical protein